MNGRSRKSMQSMTAAPRAASIGRVVTLVAAFSLSACADIRRAVTLPPVNPESPVASAVASASRRTPPTPSFLDVPPVVKNVPTPAATKVAVVTLVRCRRAFERFDTAHPQLVADTAAFAEARRGEVDTNLADVPTVQDTASAEAYAAGLRAYAVAPAPIASGPPPSAAEALPPTPGAPRPPHPSPTHPAAAPAPPAAAPPSPPPSSAPVAVASAGALAIDGPLPVAGPDPLLVRCR